ncbi:MAG: methionine--tRNA ligase [Candidatus Shapirobacteria bacterium]|nr:methionine--tRNA ligase [Candidatus Shapirobacteria bacterium]MDD5074089.1 methionine--tRNA ligase [Candidatus Shapirobacteria bacterium]MDD5481423.1 methionine--tRNA ligase [Candidatus Shapirobacteria bacterium]
MKKFYLTTAIDYANDVIHVGHAYQKVVADIFARYHQLLGREVFFLTGSDEHGGKVEEAARQAGQDTAGFVDRVVAGNKEQLAALNINFNRYIRTTDQDHVRQVKNFYLRVKKNGDIYRAKFSGFYCSGCEEYKTASELVGGCCPHHPNLPIRQLAEENYFFAWSKYREFLVNHIKAHPDFIKPKSRAKEMLSFLDQGLNDISISRQSVSWGIPVPDDPAQTLYVWFDALINYVTGAPEGFWPANLHLLGKDNTRWHALLWPAMLKSAGLPLPKTIYAHGFLTLNGQKISKSLGNIIRPSQLAKEFGVDGARYLLASAKTLGGDGDISWAKMKEKYNADLANGLGNLVSRLAKLCQLSEAEFGLSCPDNKIASRGDFSRLMANYQLLSALSSIWDQLRLIDQELNQCQPWKMTSKKKQAQVLSCLVNQLLVVAVRLSPFLPQTAKIIKRTFLAKKIIPPKPLFARI